MENKAAEDKAASQLAKWRSEGSEERVRVTGANGDSTHGAVYIQVWTQRQRMQRAVMFGVGCVGLAIVCIPVVLLHFILVPGFLLAAPFMAMNAYKQPSVVLGGHASCPKCKAPLKIVRQKVIWPLKDVCSACYENVRIEKAFMATRNSRRL